MIIDVLDEFDDSVHEFDISDELYDMAFNGKDLDALFEIAEFIYNTGEVSDLPVLDMMSEAWDDGEGSERAGIWLDDYYEEDDDGRYDAWI